MIQTILKSTGQLQYVPELELVWFAFTICFMIQQFIFGRNTCDVVSFSMTHWVVSTCPDIGDVNSGYHEGVSAEYLYY